MKMSKRIFRMAILVAFIVLIASTAFIMGILYDFFEKQLENELASEAQYVSFGIDKVGMEYLDGFESSDGNRITVIAPDGEVRARCRDYWDDVVVHKVCKVHKVIK